MDIFKKLLHWFDTRKNFIVILNIIMLLLCCYLLYETSSLWQNLCHLFIIVIKPFFIAFVIAYVFEPFVESLTRFKIKRHIAIALVILLLLIIAGIFVGSLVPLLYDKISDIVGPLYDGLAKLQKILLEHFNIDITNIVTKATKIMQDWIVNLSFMDTTISIITSTLNKIGAYTINLILAIYFLADYPRIHQTIKRLAYKINTDFGYCLKQIDIHLAAYIKAFLILMMIQTAIYSCIYLIIGHNSWLLLGLLSGVACIFPYIGPMAVNALGIITALGMPTTRIILLLVAIFIQSNVDSYIITPKVYSSRIQIEPIFVIFALLSSSTIFGPWGIVVAMPLLVILKIIFQTLKELHSKN